AHEIAQRPVEEADAERLPGQPGMQVENEDLSRMLRLAINGVEGALDLLAVLVDPEASVPQREDVVELQQDGKCIERRWGVEAIGLVVVHPVADIAQARFGQEPRRTRGLPVFGAMP